MHSIRFKLLLGTLAVALVAVAVLAAAATRATSVAFTSYVRQGQAQRLQRVQADLADFYTRNGSWTNVQATLNQSANTMAAGMGRMGQGMAQGAGRGNQGMTADQQAILADAQGAVIAATGSPYAGARLSEHEMAAALPITVGGRTVGYLLGLGAGLSTFSSLEHQFITSVNQALLIASLFAGAVAVFIALVVARRLTAPLTSMTQAAQAMARGDLAQRVPVASDDEMGRLAEAFNTMAISLARAEELRRNLVADVAHELRTPLAVLRADLEALQDGVYQPTPERLTALHEETDLLARLVSDLHELTLAEAGQLKMERRPTNVAQVCQQTVSIMQAQAATRGVMLSIGQADDGAVVLADADRVGQVLRNLIANALRYTPADGAVTLDCRVDGQDALLSVRDTGTGIRPDDLPHIFDRFYRGEKSRARATGGAGLGLAIVKQLVEAHRGRVWAESSPGQGATFYIRLPLA
jgi:two-component system OmpR family sensor kinase/two-component system sensor histidine kinase BaeS